MRQMSFAVLTLICLAGCQMVSQYDLITDQSVTSLQRQTTALFVDLNGTVGTPEGAYDHYKEQYDQIAVDLSVLTTRAKAIPQNDLTVQQLALLQNQLDKLRSIHERGLKKFELPLLQSGIDRTCGAVMKLELAKKDMRSPTP